MRSFIWLFDHIKPPRQIKGRATIDYALTCTFFIYFVTETYNSDLIQLQQWTGCKTGPQAQTCKRPFNSYLGTRHPDRKRLEKQMFVYFCNNF